MFANTQSRPDFEASKALRQSLRQASAVNRGGRVLVGTVLLVSALGLWLMPLTVGDAGMRLIMLVLSVCLLALGAMFIFSARERLQSPDIHVDTRARELHILEGSGSLTMSFDDLRDVAFTNRRMTARTADGKIEISLPLTDPDIAKALRAAFHESHQ